MTLRLTVELRDQGLRRWIGALIGSAKDRPGLLRAMGRVALKDSKERFQAQGPGWAPRADSTEEAGWSKLQARVEGARGRAEQAVRRKLKGELRRALRKFSPAVERRYEALKEFERYVAGGRRDVALTALPTGEDGGQAAEKLGKTLARTRERLGRAEARTRERLLGGLASANRLTVESAAAVIRNVAKNKRGQSFSGVQNSGGTAGHGAQIPARPFLLVDQALLDKLPQVALDHLMRPVLRGKK